MAVPMSPPLTKRLKMPIASFTIYGLLHGFRMISLQRLRAGFWWATPGPTFLAY